MKARKEERSIQYTAEFYEGSYSKDPVSAFVASTPFLQFAVGDFIHPQAAGSVVRIWIWTIYSV
jgi:hypothetical protein